MWLCLDILPVLLVLTCSVLLTSARECNIKLACYGQDDLDTIGSNIFTTPYSSYNGYLEVNGIRFDTFESTFFLSGYSGTKRKRRAAPPVPKTASDNGWRLYTFTDTCEPSGKHSIPFDTVGDNERFLEEISTIVENTLTGSYIIGCSAGGVEQVNSSVGIKTYNFLQGLGVKVNKSLDEDDKATGNSSYYLTQDRFNSSEYGYMALMFTAQKGFPQHAFWKNVRFGTGVRTIERTLKLDWHCGVPPMPGSELFKPDNYASTMNYAAHIVINTPLTCSGAQLMGWEYIANAAVPRDQIVYLAIFEETTPGASYTIIQRDVLYDKSAGTDDRRYRCSRKDNFKIPEKRVVYGFVTYGIPPNAPAAFRSVQEQFKTEFGGACGRGTTAADVDTEFVIADNLGLVMSTNVIGLGKRTWAIRPIFDQGFMLDCGCVFDKNCQTEGDLHMVCAPVFQTCRCRKGYSYNRNAHKCIYDANLAEFKPVQTSLLATSSQGKERYLTDSNKDGAWQSGTCISTYLTANKPYVVVDLEKTTDVHALKITPGKPSDGYLVLSDSSRVLTYTLTGSEYDVRANTPFSINGQIKYVIVTGPYVWQLYSGTNYTVSDTVLLHGAGVYDTATDTSPCFANIGSIRRLTDLALFRYTDSVTGVKYCMDVDGSNNLILSQTCKRYFFIDASGNFILDQQSLFFVKLGAGGSINAPVSIGSGTTTFKTSDTDMDGTSNLDVKDFDAGGASIILQQSPSVCLGKSGTNIVLKNYPANCVSFTLDRYVTISSQISEIGTFNLNANSDCNDDKVSFGSAFSNLAQPCVEEIGIYPTNRALSTTLQSKIYYVDNTEAWFTAVNPPAGIQTCTDTLSEIFYRVTAMGLYDFHIGVSDTLPTDVDRTTFSDCIYYNGNLKNGEASLINCTSVVRGRYVAIYIENYDTSYLEQMHLCNIQVFGEPVPEYGSSCTFDAECQTKGEDKLLCNILTGQSSGTCQCRQGFTYNKIKGDCEDYNECDTGNGGCTDVCTNTFGSYFCQCGHPDTCILMSDRHTCTCCAHNSEPLDFTSDPVNVLYLTDTCSRLIGSDTGYIKVDFGRVITPCRVDFSLSTLEYIFNKPPTVTLSLVTIIGTVQFTLLTDRGSHSVNVSLSELQTYAEQEVFNFTVGGPFYGKFKELQIECISGSTQDYFQALINLKIPERTFLTGPKPDYTILDTGTTILNCNTTDRISIPIQDHITAQVEVGMSDDAALTKKYEFANVTFTNLNENKTSGQYGEVVSGQYMYFKMPNVEYGKTIATLSKYFICNLQVYEGDAYACRNGTNGGCEHTCHTTGGALGDYNCSCHQGYKLQNDFKGCTDIDECTDKSLHICDDDPQQLGLCDNYQGSYNCSCQYFERGVYWDAGQQACALQSSSKNTGSADSFCSVDNGFCEQNCIAGNLSMLTDYQCECNSGFDKQPDGRSCIDLNECNKATDHICDDDVNKLAYCDNQLGTYNCSCLYDHRGVSWNGTACTTGFEPDNLCSVYNGYCEHNCTAFVGNTVPSPVVDYRCDCWSGFVLRADGRSCGDVDECKTGSNICSAVKALPKPNCVNTYGSYQCSCPNGYTWNQTTVQCDSVKVITGCEVKNGGCEHICTDQPSGYNCTCHPGFILLKNEHGCQDIDECKVDNGGCSQKCVNNIASYHCGCKIGYELDADNRTCIDVNECARNNGGCFHNCTNSVGSYRCSCEPGFTLWKDGHFCDDIDECVTKNGGCAQVCENTPGSFVCTCNNGYASPNNDGLTCNDIDECSTGVDKCEQNCKNTLGSYTCSCNSSQVLLPDGVNCDDIDECAKGTDKCRGLSTCENTMKSYKCNCASGYSSSTDGLDCSNVNECTTLNGGCDHTCVDNTGSYTCACLSGYKLLANGRGCADIDECATDTGGCAYQCQNTLGSFRCICPTNYKVSGVNCVGPFSLQLKTALNTTFTSALQNSQSPEYTNFVTNVKANLKKVVKNKSSNQKFQDITIKHLRAGSVIVTYDVIYSSPLTTNEISVIPTAIKQGITEQGGAIILSNTTSIAVIGDPVVVYQSADGSITTYNANNVCDFFTNTQFCKGGSSCQSTNGLPSCVCLPGYEGTDCSKVISSGALTSNETIILITVIIIFVFLILGMIMLCCYIKQLINKQRKSRYVDNPPTSTIMLQKSPYGRQFGEKWYSSNSMNPEKIYDTDRAVYDNRQSHYY